MLITHYSLIMSVAVVVALVYNPVPSDSPPAIATAVVVGWWWWWSALLRDSELEPSAIRTLLTAITMLLTSGEGLDNSWR